MIIYQDTKTVFTDDIASNNFAARIEDAFIRKTGSLTADSRGWANDYTRFSNVLSQAAVSGDITVAIEYHCSPVGRSRTTSSWRAATAQSIMRSSSSTSTGAPRSRSRTRAMRPSWPIRATSSSRMGNGGRRTRPRH